jgi:SAM-dependent methyltransferase
MGKQSKTSWESSSKWYDTIVGEKGHYYHEKVIFPNLLPLMDLKGHPSPKVLDLACGQGVLSRVLPKEIPYVGVDLSPSLIQAAKQQTKNPKHHFYVHDIGKKFELKEKDFTHCCILLALQNIEPLQQVFENCAVHLAPKGKLYIVLNHPCFRIPRHSSWQVDEEKKLQYRRIDSYLSSQKIPIQTHPGKGKASTTTWSFHHPLSEYSAALAKAGFCILQMEEWISDKVSVGGKARMENRARQQFPLFLALRAQKLF